MARYQASVASRRPATETFEYLATFSNAAQWDPGVLTGEREGAGPLAVGSRFRLVVRFVGGRLPLTYEIADFEPSRQVTLRARNALLTSADRIEVSGEGDGARVDYQAEVRLRGPLALLDPMLRRGFSAVADRAAGGLARVLADGSRPLGAGPDGMEPDGTEPDGAEPAPRRGGGERPSAAGSDR